MTIVVINFGSNPKVPIFTGIFLLIVCNKTSVLTVLISFPIEMKNFTYTSCLAPQCHYTNGNF